MNDDGSSLAIHSVYLSFHFSCHISFCQLLFTLDKRTFRLISMPEAVLVGILTPTVVVDSLCLSSVQGIEKFQADLNTLHPILTECRVVKSDLELALIQFANDISSEAHVEVSIVLLFHGKFHLVFLILL